MLIPDPHDSPSVYRYQVGTDASGSANVITGAHIVTVEADDDFEVTAYSYPNREVIASHVNIPTVGIDSDSPYTVIVSSLQPAIATLREGNLDTPAHVEVIPGVENANLNQFYSDTVALCRAADLLPTKDTAQSWEFRSSPNITTRGLEIYLPEGAVFVIISMADADYIFKKDDEESQNNEYQSLIGQGEGLIAYRIDEPGSYTIRMTAIGATSILEAHLFTRS